MVVGSTVPGTVAGGPPVVVGPVDGGSLDTGAVDAVVVVDPDVESDVHPAISPSTSAIDTPTTPP